MKPDSESTCPYTGHKDLCRKHYMNCPKWIMIQGTNPNTGQPINEAKCADAWMPLLMVENSMQQHQTGAAVESFRNEMVKSNEISLQVLLATAKGNQLPMLPRPINDPPTEG